MDFIEELRNLSARIDKQKRCNSNRRGNEKRFRHALHQPFGV